MASFVLLALGLWMAWPPGAAAGPRELVPGPWRAWLDCPGGDLPFELDILPDGAGLEAWILNGKERLPVPRVYWAESELMFDIDHYDVMLRATTNESGSRLDGRWRRRLGPNHWAELPFHAVAGPAPRFIPEPAPEESGCPETVDGRWAAKFAIRPDSSVVILESGPGHTVSGTILNATGDYRYLAGTLECDRLRLSRFDGAHAFLLDARLQPDGTLRGRFWEGGYLEDTWTARLDPEACPPDPFALLKLSERVDLASLSFPDLEGRMRTLSDPAFAGKVLIIEILGTWCPNCHDATEFLMELHERYRESGLSVVGLAFEMTGNLERNTRFLRRYKERHHVEYPLLLAWTDVLRSPSEIFPTIRGDYAFPTILFLSGDGRVRATYVGFSGPATGQAHDELRSRFQSLVEELLSAEDASGGG